MITDINYLTALLLLLLCCTSHWQFKIFYKSLPNKRPPYKK